MLAAFFCLVALPALAGPSRADFLKLAQTGWVYDLDTARMRRPGTVEPKLDSREVALGDICLFGETPTPLTRSVVTAYTGLLRRIYGRTAPVTFAGDGIESCPPHQRMYIRVYSGTPPSSAFNGDLKVLDREFDIRFPPRWHMPVASPAEANGFFGRNGATAHLMISQAPGEPTPLQTRFYTSILIEEMYQVVSFGADILKFDRDVPFLSKLQEVPVNLRYRPWTSEAFMRGLLGSNPAGLCGFDVFMLHALAASRLDSTNSEQLLTFIDANFDRIAASTRETMQDPAFALLLDDGCTDLPD